MTVSNISHRLRRRKSRCPIVLIGPDGRPLRRSQLNTAGIVVASRQQAGRPAPRRLQIGSL